MWERPQGAETKERVPPGQVVTDRWPVLHYGRVPRIDLATWRFRVHGRVQRPVEWTWEEWRTLPRSRTGWTRLDNDWEGVAYAELRRHFQPLPDARHVLVHAAGGWTTNLPLEDLERDGVVFAMACDGRPLTPEHGGPLRLVVPHLYFWKSAKWVSGLELLATDLPGFWERAGYHLRGDPWGATRQGGVGQRFADD
jgi:DMSO/TMAO reductase YedYZ molybdopterin-dependent catalytic subunit